MIIGLSWSFTWPCSVRIDGYGRVLEVSESEQSDTPFIENRVSGDTMVDTSFTIPPLEDPSADY